MKRYALFIDHEACWGCKACEVACKQENNSPDGVKLISVWEDGPKLVGGKLDFVFHVNVCQHCDDPPCTQVCPEEAIIKRQDGIVVMDYDRCSGCQSCMEACPYGAIDFDDQKGIAQKCNLCQHRVDKCLIPACADNGCPTHRIHFGPLDEENRDVQTGTRR